MYIVRSENPCRTSAAQPHGDKGSDFHGPLVPGTSVGNKTKSPAGDPRGANFRRTNLPACHLCQAIANVSFGGNTVQMAFAAEKHFAADNRRRRINAFPQLIGREQIERRAVS